MSNLRPVNEVYGMRIRASGTAFQSVLLKEWMLKPLWLQYALGVERPVHKLPGVVAEFTKESQTNRTSRICINFEDHIYLVLERIDEPQYEYQLVIVR